MRPTTLIGTFGLVLAVVCGVELLAHGPLVDLDVRVALSFIPDTPGPATSFALFLEHIGVPWLWCIVLGVLGGVSSLLTWRIEPLAAVAIGLGTAGLCTLILKSTFPHPSIYGRAPGSFPSGHTAVAVVASGLLVRLLMRSRPSRTAFAVSTAAIWGAVMAWGRVDLNLHWLSDVIAGWGLGMFALVLALRTADAPPGRPGSGRSAPAGTR